MLSFILTKVFFSRFKLMMESGLDVRSNRRELIYRLIYSKYQDENRAIPIKLYFIEKILIWMSAGFSTCAFVLLIEFTKNLY